MVQYVTNKVGKARSAFKFRLGRDTEREPAGAAVRVR